MQRITLEDEHGSIAVEHDPSEPDVLVIDNVRLSCSVLRVLIVAPNPEMWLSLSRRDEELSALLRID